MLSLLSTPGPAPDLVDTKTSSDIKGSTSCSCKSMMISAPSTAPCHHHPPPSRSSCLLETLRGFLVLLSRHLLNSLVEVNQAII